MKNLTKDKISLTLLIYNIIILALSISYFTYSMLLLQNIETLLRVGIILFFIFLAVMFTRSIIKNTFKRKKIKIIIVTILSTIFGVGITIVAYNINKIYSAISSISATEQTYSASLVVKKDSNLTEINNITNEKIGILNDTESVDGYQIPQEIIKENKLENELVEYSNYIDLINDLLDEKIDIIFLPTNYSILFANIDGLETLNEKTKIIYTKDKNVKTQKTLGTKNLDEPFSILLMGVDSEQEEIKGSSFNGDSLVLVTFNPKTLNATILSIPRDTYTSITCFAGQRKNKITHAAWYGESCMMKTIEKMFDVNIDYYVKINFKGVVNIVDALGGVDVDVPFSFCEQNSNREFGNSTIYVREGFQTLNGEQALALARNRHPWPEYCSKEWTNYNSSDFVRGQNQQKLIQAMLNKLKNINSVDTFYDMLNSISQSMETNMSTENILSFYNIAKDILIKNTSSNQDLSSLIGFQRLYLSGYDQRIVDYDTINNTGSQLSLYNFVPYKGSINDISKAMKINLGQQAEEKIYSYDFDVNEPYEEKIIGKGSYNEAGIALLPSFVGRSVSEAQSYCNSRGIALTINKVSTNSSSLDGQVMTQSLPSGMDVEFVSKSKGITLSVAEYSKTAEPTTETTIPGTPKDDDTTKQTDTTTDKDKKTKKDDTTNTTTNNGTTGTDTTTNDNTEKPTETPTEKKQTETPAETTIPGTPTDTNTTEE